MNLEEYLHMLHEMERRSKERRFPKDEPSSNDSDTQRR